ncbi:MAG: sigma-54-dependent Fis family transcriptional regulator, partial [Candidatus Latescibacterota bacterium]
ESEFFGHERGAFTGAGSRRIGKLEQAKGGTVFLDEIGEIPLGIQVKILRVLQEKSFERVGGNDTIEADIRLIAATNRNLERAMAEGRFREDLYHRLNVVTILVPPLRERREDVPLLTNYFLERTSRQLQIERPTLTEEALRVLVAYSWPGNVRELEHCLHRAVIFSRGFPIQEEDVRRALERQTEESDIAPGAPEGWPAGEEEADLRSLVQAYLDKRPDGSAHRPFLELVDKLLVVEALRRTEGNQTRAAKLLGLTRPTLQGKMQRYGVRRTAALQDD